VEIASLSGFCDQAAFTRTFSRIERMTPSRWRRVIATDKSREDVLPSVLAD